MPDGGLAAFQSNIFIVSIQEYLDLEAQKDQNNGRNVGIPCKYGKDLYAGGPYGKIEESGCQNTVDFYCTKCKCLACSDCINSSHKSHSLEVVSERAQKEKDGILGTIEEAREDITELTAGIGYMQKYQAQLRKAKDETTTKINNQASALKKLIDDLQKEMITNINNVYNEENDKVNEIIKQNKDTVSCLKTFNDFTEKLLKEASDTDALLWRRLVEQERGILADHANHDSVNMVIKNPVDIKYKGSNMNTEFTLKRLMGSVQHGYNLDIIDKSALKITRARPKSAEPDPATPPGSPKHQLAKNRIHPGRLVNSFSIFTDGSHFSPLAVDVTTNNQEDILVVDRNNKCLKFFAPSGGMYRKIHGGESIWGVSVLSNGDIAVTDKTVHVFDKRGRIVRVLRQQPRDSHGITTNSNGDIIVGDCASKCIYILAEIGGTIKRIITQRGGKTFKSPKYIAVNRVDDIIVSDNMTHTVSIMSDKGVFMYEFGNGEPGKGETQLNCPMGVCADKLGNIIVCDTGNNRVILLNPKANFLCTLVEGTEDISQPQAVCIDKQGNMVIAQEGGRVRVFKYRESQWYV